MGVPRTNVSNTNVAPTRTVPNNIAAKTWNVKRLNVQVMTIVRTRKTQKASARKTNAMQNHARLPCSYGRDELDLRSEQMQQSGMHAKHRLHRTGDLQRSEMHPNGVRRQLGLQIGTVLRRQHLHGSLECPTYAKS